MDIFEQPWRKLTDDHLPAAALNAPGWLLPIERKLLWWTGAKYWQGLGQIVDAGAFCGASAVAFASGVRASANSTAGLGLHSDAPHQLTGSRHGPVVSFDKFMNVDDLEAEFIQHAFGARLLWGDSFLDYYLQAVSPYLDLVRVEAGDFLAKKWSGRPIEILFLDICKTKALNAHALSEFIPHLIPGHSLVIQQDFMGIWLPHINWSMEYLSDYFEIVDTECGPSRVYRLKKPVPQKLIDNIVLGRLSLDERLGLLDRLRRESLFAGSPHIAMLAEGMKLQELILEGQLDRYDEMWGMFLQTHSISPTATKSHFLGEAWVIESIPNWIPMQIMSMHDDRLKVQEPTRYESAWLGKVHVQNAKLLPNRTELLPLLPKGGVVAEIGVAYGDFSKLILDVVKPTAFYAFDIFTFEKYATVWGRSPLERLKNQTHLEFFETRFADQIETGNVRVEHGQSWENLSKFPDAYFDIIYVDGNHTLEGVRKDTDVAVRTIKPDGILIYNDYISLGDRGESYGVVSVVNDLCVNHGWEIIYYALEPEMFCDVALRRR